MPTLLVENVFKSFGSVRAVDGVSFEIPHGTIVGLIGPNGSGKTTLVNLISGLERAETGAIWYDGRRIDGLPPYKLARRGIGRTFQTVKLFGGLDAVENVLLAGLRKNGMGARAKAMVCLETVGIVDMADADAGTLSVGQQRLLELAMNLMVEPALWLLDEPVAGLHPNLRLKVANLVRRFREEGKTFLIIEHNIPFVLDLCDKVMVLHMGRMIAEGTPADVVREKRVLDAYLGRRVLQGERPFDAQGG